jgi:hypothetical protein
VRGEGEGEVPSGEGIERLRALFVSVVFGWGWLMFGVGVRLEGSSPWGAVGITVSLCVMYLDLSCIHRAQLCPAMVGIQVQGPPLMRISRIGIGIRITAAFGSSRTVAPRRSYIRVKDCGFFGMVPVSRKLRL